MSKFLNFNQPFYNKFWSKKLYANNATVNVTRGLLWQLRGLDHNVTASSAQLQFTSSLTIELDN